VDQHVAHLGQANADGVLDGVGNPVGLLHAHLRVHLHMHVHVEVPAHLADEALLDAAHLRHARRKAADLRHQREVRGRVQTKIKKGKKYMLLN